MEKILITLINVYKRYISPYKGTKCPYFPSCSDYAITAIKRHGAFKGFLLSLWRIMRCNPFSKGGVDEVPIKLSDIYLYRRSKQPFSI